MTQPGEKARKAANENIIERMRRGETLSSVPVSATWFPPRPLIKKDPKSVERLYGNKEPTFIGNVSNETGEIDK